MQLTGRAAGHPARGPGAGKAGKVLFVVSTERSDIIRLIMAMTRITLEDGQKPTKEQLKEIREAAKRPQVYDPDCPPSTLEALAEFAAKARELRQSIKNTKPAVTIRMTPACLSKYKALGKGYTGIMADVLNYVADNPEILSKVCIESTN